MIPDPLLTGVRHPYWSAKIQSWQKWRLAYDGGDEYVDAYLEKFSEREDDKEFKRRKRVTPRPNFAKSAVNEIKNSIYQRLTDVCRRGGSDTYQKAVRGEDFGIDLQGSSMNHFIGKELLKELLVMSRVGVFVDMPPVTGRTLRDALGKRPYTYIYRAEDILSWSCKQDSPEQLTSVLLRDYTEVCHSITGLPMGVQERYRYMFVGEDGYVHVQFFKQVPVMAPSVTGPPRTYNDQQVDINGDSTTEDTILDIGLIPFVLIELTDSLMADVVDHQIALLQMESSDINYALKANFPFYTEQINTLAQSQHLMGPTPTGDGTAATGKSNDSEIKVGATVGRRYGEKMERPGFIHPSSEPLKISMEKQAAIKEDIRKLVHLSLANVKSKMASAESKSFDERGLDAGLSNIGLVLEHAERRIAYFWHLLEGANTAVATIRYPEKWSLKTDQDRRDDAKSLRALRDTIPSATFQRSISKEIAQLLLGSKVSNEELDTIMLEIDKAKIFTADPETIFGLIDRGGIDLVTVAGIFGLPPEVVAKAAQEHAERLVRIMEAQSQGNAPNDAGARGIKDLSANNQSGSQEKAASRDMNLRKDTKSPVRGQGKEDAQL